MSEILDHWKRLFTAEGYPLCDVCTMPLSWEHDHKPDQSGLDDGPPLGRQYVKRAPAKSPEEMKAIRAKAWATRRANYGPCGNRKYGSPHRHKLTGMAGDRREG